ncbi:MAG TPA: hypothetical protein VGG26_09215 [Terracidiphilus sp.]
MKKKYTFLTLVMGSLGVGASVHVIGKRHSRELIEDGLQSSNYSYTLNLVTVQIDKRDLFITIPLNQIWEKTENESRNRKIFRYFEGIDLPVNPVQQAGLQVLITYRNLDKLLDSQRPFIEW